MGRLILLLFVLLSEAALAQPLTVTATPTNVGVNEPFELQVIVRGSEVTTPQLPEIDNVVIDRNRVQKGSSTTVQFINGRMSTQQLQSWTYSAVAKIEGILVIPPVSATIDGKEYVSDPIRIEVKKRSPVSIPRRGQRGNQQQAAQGLTLDEAVRVTGEVDKREVFEGEPVELTISLYTLNFPGVWITNEGTNAYIPPDTEGFFSTAPAKSERRDVALEGYNWNIQEFKQLLFPTRAGELKISSWNWSGEVRSATVAGSRRASVNPETEEITIHVKSLPPSPPNFSGAVGEFEMQANLASAVTLQGVPVQLNVRITGRGNPDVISPPAFPAVEWAHISTPSSEEQGQDPVQINKVFQFTITPHQAGNFELPPVEFVFFDPDPGEYRTASTGNLSLSVTPAEESGPMVVAGGASPATTTSVEVVTQDLLPQITGGVNLRPRKSGAIANGVFTVAPPLAFLLFAGYLRRKRHFESHPDEARKHFARSKGMARLREVENAQAPADAIYRAAVGFAADHFDAKEAGMTSEDVRQLLESHQTPPETIERYVKVLKACERARYAGVALAPEEVHALKEAAAVAMDSLEPIARARR